jgi:hypothetical protein
MAAVNPAVEQLRAAVERLLREGRAEGIEPGGPLGVWLEAQAQALQGFAAILDGQEARFGQALAKIEAANKSELEKLSAAVLLAREAAQQGELALLQARNAQVLHVVERENLVQRMIKETLPEFVTALKGVLVIRETRWNRRKESVRFALAGLGFAAVFIAGYGLSFWRDQDDLAAFDRCLTSQITANGHVYCSLDFLAPQAAASARPQ